MTTARVVIATGVVILAALAVNTYVSLHDHAELKSFVQAESVQRVTTVGERCETTDHQHKVAEHSLPRAYRAEAEWFKGSYARCLKSRGHVERRAGTKYKEVP